MWDGKKLEGNTAAGVEVNTQLEHCWQSGNSLMIGTVAMALLSSTQCDGSVIYYYVHTQA